MNLTTQSTNDAFDGIHRIPVDRTSAMMFAKGVLPPEVKVACEHWEICPPLKSQPLVQFQTFGGDLTSKRKGRLVVVGMARDWQARWVVRCDCGDYELRTARALKNPNNINDKCVKCRRIDIAKRYHEFFATGKNRDVLKQGSVAAPEVGDVVMFERRAA